MIKTLTFIKFVGYRLQIQSDLKGLQRLNSEILEMNLKTWEPSLRLLQLSLPSDPPLLPGNQASFIFLRSVFLSDHIMCGIKHDQVNGLVKRKS